MHGQLFLGWNLVIWKSKKQSVVFKSSAKTELRAITQGVCELLWLENNIKRLNDKER